MSVRYTLFDDKSQSFASISENGEVIVRPISYSTAYYVSVDVVDTAFIIVPAEAGHKFIMTSMLIASSKTFGTATTAETVTLYEASSADINTNLKTIAQIDMLKNDRLVATQLNLESSEAITIVAIATDTNVDVTIAGYYVNANNSSNH